MGKERNFDIDIDLGLLIKYKGPGGDVVIPAGVTIIGEDAFKGCTGLQSVTISAGVTVIGQCEFYGCTGLQSVTIPKGIKEIGYSAFRDCTGLQSVTISAGVKEIGGDAFYGCTGLRSVTIPAEAKVIGENAFTGCTGLQSVTVPKSVKKIDKSVFEDCSPMIVAPHIPVGDFAPKNKPGACAGFAKRYLKKAKLDEEIGAGYLKYIKRNKERLYPAAIQHEELLQLMFAEKFITRKDIDPLLEECDKQGNVTAKAAVLEYADKNLKPVDPMKEFKL